jgi:ATP-dependent Clp protease ATP-binding subunit ClpC
MVAAVTDAHGDAAATQAFAGEIVGMYRAWAELRGMSWRELDSRPCVACCTGFAAWPILRCENGLHVLESGDGKRSCRDRDTVAAQPPQPATGAAELELARQQLQPVQSTTPAVVRRYKKAPSPEVKDRVRGWRTGRLDRVFGGEFDVME